MRWMNNLSTITLFQKQIPFKFEQVASRVPRFCRHLPANNKTSHHFAHVIVRERQHIHPNLTQATSSFFFFTSAKMVSVYLYAFICAQPCLLIGKFTLTCAFSRLWNITVVVWWPWWARTALESLLISALALRYCVHLYSKQRKPCLCTSLKFECADVSSCLDCSLHV